MPKIVMVMKMEFDVYELSDYGGATTIQEAAKWHWEEMKENSEYKCSVIEGCIGDDSGIEILNVVGVE